ncbi:MAG TPA: hypothetical protein VHC63_16685 [Acidimicrobiales bacterium]|nr:hypothetical protein [Acidimicrobiales bacterium]
MLRRIFAVAAAAGALLGLGATQLASPAKAATTDVVSPVPTGLLRLCIIAHAADTGVCIHL